MAQEDNAIIGRIQAGETALFSQLYEHYARPIYAFVFYKTHHRETAEDLTSQTFFKALDKIQSFDFSKGTFQAWLYQIARNCVYDHFRSFKRTADINDVWDLATDENIPYDVAVREQLTEVCSALKLLKPAQREILILRIWQGKSYTEIGEIVGKSASACKMDFCRATRELKKSVIVLLLVLFSAV